MTKGTPPVGDARQLWEQCGDLLRPQVSDGVWRSTFSDARPLSFDGESLALSVPSVLVKERIERQFLDVIGEALRAVEGVPVVLDISVEPEHTSHDEITDPLDIQLGPDTGRTHVPPQEDPVRPQGPTMDSSSPRYTFEAFVTGPSNRFAQAAALRVAETPGESYNPLFMYGDAGLGKTHLLQAIGQYVRENYPQYQVRYVSSEKFLNEFVDSIRTGTNDQFKRRYREVDVLLVDDIQFIENRKETQEEFFHTFNALYEQGKQIVLSSDRPPDNISTLENRLRSRFKMGLIVDIQPPDLETRLAILRKKSEPEPNDVPAEVLEFIATNITDNIRELEGALIRVSAYANLTQQELTAELAEKVLSDILGDRQPRPITVQLILETTAEMYEFSVEALIGSSRQRPLVNARQAAMYVARELTDLSYPAIAREFGGRDHTTVIHAVEKIRNLMPERRQVYDQVTDLIQKVKRG